MDPIVTLDRVDVRLDGADVLSGITLALRRGDGIAVLGPNGSGKSSLLRLLRGELWPDPRSAGRRLFHAPDGAFESPIGVRERLARVAPEQQDAYVRNDWDLPVEVVIRSGFFDALWPETPATPEQRDRVRAAARALGVAHLLGRVFTTLSRGEGRRVLVARALAPAPDALLLDEACDGLDGQARAELLARVEAIWRAGTAVVMATHRADEIPPGMDRVLWMEGGRIVREGTRAEARREAGLEERGGATSTSTPISPVPTPASTPPLFVLRGVRVMVEGQAALDGIDWTIRRGERWCVLGHNGAGKSTLLRLLAGAEQPAAGVVLRLDLGRRAGVEDLRGRVGLVSPELQARHRLDARAGDVILSGFAGSIGLAVPPTDAERAAAARAVARLGIEDLVDRRILSLSYGELRKVLLARALAPDPDVLLLDEPLAGLDPGARAAVLRLLDAVRAGGTAVVAVSHHADELPPHADGVLRLAAGRVVG